MRIKPKLWHSIELIIGLENQMIWGLKGMKVLPLQMTNIHVEFVLMR